MRSQLYTTERLNNNNFIYRALCVHSIGHYAKRSPQAWKVSLINPTAQLGQQRIREEGALPRVTRLVSNAGEI